MKSLPAFALTLSGYIIFYLDTLLITWLVSLTHTHIYTYTHTYTKYTYIKIVTSTLVHLQFSYLIPIA